VKNCPHCRKAYDASAGECPRCGSMKPGGTFQTSTVMISVGAEHRVYRSVDEVPAGLRTKLLKSTNGSNSATILIADRGGRQQIARAMRSLPGSAQRRLMQAVLGTEAPSGAMAWLTPARRRAILVGMSLLTAAVVGLVFTKLG
jgi:hypothetical protein